MPDERSFKLDDWSDDEELSASKLNQTVTAIKAITRGIAPPSQIPPDPGSKPSLEVQQFQIESIAGDYLICNPWDGVQAKTSQVFIARPWMLRRSMDSRGALTFTYADDQSRTADDGSTTEDQVIVPSYAVGDVIFATRNITGGTGATYSSNGKDTAIDWLDLNDSARAWAKAAS